MPNKLLKYIALRLYCWAYRDEVRKLHEMHSGRGLDAVDASDQLLIMGLIHEIQTD